MNKIDRLTPCERLVCNLQAKGLCVKEVAQQLNIAVGTAKSHLARIYSKVGVHSALELQTIINSMRLRHELVEQTKSMHALSQKHLLIMNGWLRSVVEQTKSMHALSQKHLAIINGWRVWPSKSGRA